LKLKTAAIISTACVIVAGFAMISPLFFRDKSIASEPVAPPQKVMLGFSIIERDDITGWCRQLTTLLDDYVIGATVFMPGELAEKFPECIWDFNKKIDIGSQTYSNKDLTKISDYLVKLDEVQKGKTAVDEAGDITSKAFMAPFRATDQDIYSLLGRSGIMADFSYDNQYNIYENGQFVKHDAATFIARDYRPEYFLTLPETEMPVIIFFDSTYSITEIDKYLSVLNEGYIKFVNASDLAGFSLTIR
jgi:peptidoglycan/xylan/chitin deacetylase (PgdA/CDA1 family)